MIKKQEQKLCTFFQSSKLLIGYATSAGWPGELNYPYTYTIQNHRDNTPDNTG